MKGTSTFSEDNKIHEIEKQKDILTDTKKEKAEVKETEKKEKATQKLKASWANVQFGANYFYDNWGSAYKGRGDKIKNIGVIEREADVLTGSISKSSKKYAELNIAKRENPFKLISVKEVTPPVKDFKFSPVFSLREPTKLEALKLDIKTISPEIPATFKFSINTPVIPTINPAQVNIETVELTDYATVWNRGIVGR